MKNKNEKWNILGRQFQIPITGLSRLIIDMA